MTRQQRHRDDENERKDEERKRRLEERRLRGLAVGRSRLDVIARIVILGVAIPLTVLAIVGDPHAGGAWLPMVAVGLIGAQKPRS